MKPDFETLYEAYYDKIYHYAYSILFNRENAEDVVSDTFFAAYAAYDRYDPDIASPATWLTRIAHNKAIDFVKSPAYRRRESLDKLSDESSFEVGAPDNMTEQAEKNDIILCLYAKLTKAEREFLNLRYVMELTDAEIADLYNLQVKTINKRYQRLLARCRKLLDQK